MMTVGDGELLIITFEGVHMPNGGATSLPVAETSANHNFHITSDMNFDWLLHAARYGAL
jgi:hypothetical protein